MRTLSSAAVLPAIATQSIADSVLAHPDQLLIEAGVKLERAIELEIAAEDATERLPDPFDWEHWHRVTSFNSDSNVDARLMQLLGYWNRECEAAGFCSGDIEDLSALRRLKDKRLNERISELAAINAAYRAHEQRPDVIKADEEVEAAAASVFALVMEIAALPASTFEGLQIKARAINWYSAVEFDEIPEEEKPTDARLIQSILRDLLGNSGPTKSGRSVEFTTS